MGKVVRLKKQHPPSARPVSLTIAVIHERARQIVEGVIVRAASIEDNALRQSSLAGWPDYVAEEVARRRNERS